jgi:hypothetical protein
MTKLEAILCITAFALLANSILLDHKVKVLEAEVKSLSADVGKLYTEKEITASRLKSIETATIYKNLKESK